MGLAPRRVCSACEVFWADQAGDQCWMCGRTPVGAVKRLLTEEEKADELIAQLIQLRT